MASALKLLVKDEAYLLRPGGRYRADGNVVLCPVHTDDFQTSPEVGKMRQASSPEFEVIEVRPRKSDGFPWYRVRLVDGRMGWINCVGLVGRNVVVLK
jgi:hypothetical protein